MSSSAHVCGPRPQRSRGTGSGNLWACTRWRQSRSAALCLGKSVRCQTCSPWGLDWWRGFPFTGVALSKWQCRVGNFFTLGLQTPHEPNSDDNPPVNDVILEPNHCFSGALNPKHLYRGHSAVDVGLLLQRSPSNINPGFPAANPLQASLPLSARQARAPPKRANIALIGAN